MSLFYIITLGFAFTDIALIGFFAGRIYEAKRHMSRGVTLQDFSKMTQAR